MQQVRSNNHVEGWHTRINDEGRARLNFYTLVSLLFDEACLIPVQRKLLSLKKFSSKSKRRQRALNADLFNLWDAYNAQIVNPRKITALCLLNQVSALYSTFNNDSFKKCIDDDRISDSEYEEEYESD